MNIRRISDGMPFRIAKSEALNLIKDKPTEFIHTTKSYTRSFYRRMNQSMNNEAAFKAEQVDFSDKQKKNFVEQDGRKIIGWRYKGVKTLHYELPADPKKAEEKKTWLQDIIDKACRNPNDQSLKAGILTKLAIFFGFLNSDVKPESQELKKESVDLPLYQRYVLGYGDLKNIKLA